MIVCSFGAHLQIDACVIIQPSYDHFKAFCSFDASMFILLGCILAQTPRVYSMHWPKIFASSLERKDDIH